MKLKINNDTISSRVQNISYHKNVIFFSKTVINAVKTSVVMFSIFKGKARNVDYIYSCKLRLLERLVI